MVREIGTSCVVTFGTFTSCPPNRTPAGAGMVPTMTSPARSATRRPDTFPLAATLDALERWQDERTPELLDSLRARLEGVLDAVGVSGLVLEISAPPLAALEVGAGTLSHLPERDERDGLATHALGSHEGHETIGRVYLDGTSDEAADELVSGLEMVVDAAWSRAEVHGRAERLAALEAATRAVAAELDIDRVLTVIVDRVRELVGARYAALGIADARGRIERFIASGVSPESRAEIGDVPRGHGLLGVIIRGETVRSDDMAADPRRYGFPAHHPVMTSFLGAPVMVKGRSVGNLYLTDKPDGEPFTEDDERLVEMFGVHAGIAIENARLHDQVQRLAVVEERERIGKDLHDGIIQAIYAVGLSLEDVPELVEDDEGRADAIARVDRAIDALNLVIADIRSYILRLRPAMGGPEDPVEALARLAEEVGMNAVIDLEVDLDGGADALRSLPPDRRSDLLFIAREALSNVARHSGATRTALVLAEDGEELVLCVEDNGRGFDPAEVQGPDAFGRHQGLGNMTDRAVGMGGSFAVERPDGSGARIIVRVPARMAGSSERPTAATGDR
jgi:signal transduction histidine kinase